MDPRPTENGRVEGTLGRHEVASVYSVVSPVVLGELTIGDSELEQRANRKRAERLAPLLRIAHTNIEPCTLEEDDLSFVAAAIRHGIDSGLVAAAIETASPVIRGEGERRLEELATLHSEITEALER